MLGGAKPPILGQGREPKRDAQRAESGGGVLGEGTVRRQLGSGQAWPQAVELPSCSRHGGSTRLAEGSGQAVAAAAKDAG